MMPHLLKELYISASPEFSFWCHLSEMEGTRSSASNAISDPLQILPDVPQGSILGPLHFFDLHE